MAMKWYVVHTHAGHENGAKRALEQKIREANLTDSFGGILIPMESVMEVKQGQRRMSTRKFYPSYLFVQMELSEKGFRQGLLGVFDLSRVQEEYLAREGEALGLLEEYHREWIRLGRTAGGKTW